MLDILREGRPKVLSLPGQDWSEPGADTLTQPLAVQPVEFLAASRALIERRRCERHGEKRVRKCLDDVALVEHFGNGVARASDETAPAKE